MTVAAAVEAADAVLLVDRLGRISDGIEIARRCRSIALQSIASGIGLSTTGMLIAAFGYLKPIEGTLIQEAIDVAVILNALRALQSGRAHYMPQWLFDAGGPTCARTSSSVS